MQNNKTTTIEHIIAKIDNDFNPDNSDWIPRVSVWCIEAMSQVDALRTVKSKKKLTVNDRIAYSECPINNVDIKVYDENGCEIKEASESTSSCGCSTTTEDDEDTSDTSTSSIGNTDIVNIVNTGKDQHILNFAETINDKYPYRYNVMHVSYTGGSSINSSDRNYVVVDCNKIELNFDTDCIYVESDNIETNYSSKYGCDTPVIPNNAVLIEAIVYYCMYKMLCRGYKHPVMNLQASQYGTNPYYLWTQLKEEAKREMNSGNISDDVSALFRSNFFIETFDPRN